MTIESNKPKSDLQGEKKLVREAATDSNVTTGNSGSENIVQPPALVKRQQGNPFEVNKKIRTFLDLGNGKSVNHFSQSARILHRRSSPPPLLGTSAVKVDQSCSDRRPLRPVRHPTFSINPDVMHLTGRSQSDPSSASSFISRLTAAASDDSIEPEKRRDTAFLMPPPIARSQTFTGSTSTVNEESSSQPSMGAKSPFLTSNPSRGSFIKAASSKPSRSVPKRLGRSQSHLKQAFLASPFLVRSLSDISTASSTEAITSNREQDKKDKDEAAKVTEGVFEELKSSVMPSMASCTAAMSCLSPPSAKTSSPLSAIIRRRRPSITSTATSLSGPTPDSTFLSFSDSEDDEVSNLKVTSPCASLKSKSNTTALITTATISTSKGTSTTISKRPTTLRRHQTMISSRSEFMRTLEPSNQRRTLSLLNTLGKKSLVFAPENYVPNPQREDCQVLPCVSFVSKPDDTTKRITPQTVVDVLDGKYKGKFDLLYIVDCRFPYEFEGGHIKSAVNVNTTDELEELLLQPAITDKRVLLIFHCEFSCERGPRMARHLRNQDRAANASHYPAVFYPEIYVMQGGYSGFFKENKAYCWPEAYVEMQDENHSKEFEEHMRTFGREFSRSASKGFLGTESKKSSKDDPSAPSLAPLKTVPAPRSITTTTVANKTNLANSSSSASSTNVSRSTNTTNSVSTKNVSGTTNTSGNSLTTSTASSTSINNSASGTSTNYSIHVDTKAPNTKAFASVLTSVKAAALTGSIPSPLSLPSVSKRPILGLPASSKLHRPSMRPRAKSEHILKELTNPTLARISTGDNTTNNPKMHANSNSSSNALPNPFFSGFRQTKPGFRGASP
ncbi:cell division cycle- protein [Mortierella sp. AM989]|nr:cell division cycle- protein [Mortierella sp. AM989]